MLISLIDLGCATEFHFDATIGTDGFRAPEVYTPVQEADGAWVAAIYQRGQEWMRQWYTSTYDVWAASWTLLDFLAKGLPSAYMGGTYEDRYNWAQNPANLEAFLQAEVHDEGIREFVRVTLDPNPATRLTAQEAVNHSYLVGHVETVYKYWDLYQAHIESADKAAEEIGQQYLAMSMQGRDLPIRECHTATSTSEVATGASDISTPLQNTTQHTAASDTPSSQQASKGVNLQPQQPVTPLHQLPFLGCLSYALHRQAGGYYDHHHYRCQEQKQPKCIDSVNKGTEEEEEEAKLPGSSLPPVRTPAGRSRSSADDGPSTPPQASGQPPAAIFAHPTQHTLQEQQEVLQQVQSRAAPHPTRRFLDVCMGRALRKGATKVARAAVRALPVMALGLLVSRRGKASQGRAQEALLGDHPGIVCHTSDGQVKGAEFMPPCDLVL